MEETRHIVDYSDEQIINAIELAKKHALVVRKNKINCMSALIVGAAFIIFLSFIMVELKSFKERNEYLSTQNTFLFKIISDYKANLFENEAQYCRYMIFLKSNIIIPAKFPDKYIRQMYESSIKYEVPLSLHMRLVFYENGFDTVTVSKKGARGLYQFMPQYKNTYLKKYNLKNKGVTTEIEIFCRSAKECYDKYLKRGFSPKYCWKLFLSEYNSGRDSKDGKTYNCRETNNYIDLILKNEK